MRETLASLEDTQQYKCLRGEHVPGRVVQEEDHKVQRCTACGFIMYSIHDPA